MSKGYSEESRRLARLLADKAANNLRKSGRIVSFDTTTGQYTVEPRPFLEGELPEAPEPIVLPNGTVRIMDGGWL